VLEEKACLCYDLEAIVLTQSRHRIHVLLCMSLAQRRRHIRHTHEPRVVLEMLHVNVYTAQIPR
jgi:hypothetical protein